MAAESGPVGERRVIAEIDEVPGAVGVGRVVEIDLKVSLCFCNGILIKVCTPLRECDSLDILKFVVDHSKS